MATGVLALARPGAMMTKVTPFDLDGPLVTERLRLRAMVAGDVDAVHAYQSLEDVCRYQTYEPRSRDEVAAKVAEWADARRLHEDGDYLQLAVERRIDGQVLGDLYVTLRSVTNATGELGFTVHPSFQGSGYATEAARAVLALLFGRMGLHRVVAELDPRNTASAAVCRRLGMREEARFVEDLWFKGRWADTGVWAVLDREWRQGAQEVAAVRAADARRESPPRSGAQEADG